MLENGDHKDTDTCRVYTVCACVTERVHACVSLPERERKGGRRECVCVCVCACVRACARARAPVINTSCVCGI